MNSCLGQGRVLPLHRMARRKKGLFDDSLLRLGLIVLGRWLRRGWRDVPGSRGRLHESETVNESFCFWAATLQLAGGTAFNAVRLQSSSSSTRFGGSTVRLTVQLSERIVVSRIRTLAGSFADGQTGVWWLSSDERRLALVFCLLVRACACACAFCLWFEVDRPRAHSLSLTVSHKRQGTRPTDCESSSQHLPSPPLCVIRCLISWPSCLASWEGHAGDFIEGQAVARSCR